MKSLIAGKAVLVNIQDRTHIINLKHWNITEEDVLHIFDHGGQLIYTITSPLFISRESLIFIVHDLTRDQDDAVMKTTDVMRDTMHQYPENEMIVIFTHIDLLDNNTEVMRKCDAVMASIRRFMDQEINSLELLLEHRKQDEPENASIIENTQYLLKVFKEKKSRTEFLCVSSKSYAGMDNVNKLLLDAVKKRRVTVPTAWLKFYKKMAETKKVLTSEEGHKLYTQMNSYEGPVQEIGVQVALQFFADTNLILLYDNNDFLMDFICPDIHFLVSLWQSFLYHNLTDVVNYDASNSLKALFCKEGCDLAIKRYQNEGLLGKKLLSYLWKQYGLDLRDEKTLLKLSLSIFAIKCLLRITSFHGL